MPTDPTVLVTGEAGQGLVVTPIKKLFVQALRSTFQATYPNTRLAGINIDMEYPALEEQYPGIWVRFSPTKVQASGLSPFIYTGTEIYSVWHVEGTVSFTIVALTSKERDLISDGIIEAFAFAAVMPTASPFFQTIYSSDLINITPQSDTLSPGGQSENFGTPWNENQLAYEDRYSFDIVGEVRSRVQPGNTYINLSQIQVYSTLTNAQGAPNNAIGDDGNGVWQ